MDVTVQTHVKHVMMCKCWTSLNGAHTFQFLQGTILCFENADTLRTVTGYHMRQPVHTRVKLVVCCTLHAWWLHTSHYCAPTAIFLVSF